jgi:hypothetical protein
MLTFIAGFLIGSAATCAVLGVLVLISRSTFWRIVEAVDRLIEADAEPDQPLPPPRVSRTL